MKVKQYTKTKRENMLNQADKLLAEGMSISKIIKQLGIASPTYYAWRKQQKVGTIAKEPLQNNGQRNNGKDILKENARLRNLVVNMALELSELKGE